MARPALSTLPPLKGDGEGNYRIQLVGNSGTGKSTLGNELSAILGIPHIPLDTLFWKPGWTQSTNEEFMEKVTAAISSSPHGWIVDGNYTRRDGGIIEREITDKIWLDPPLVLYFPRIFVRTFLRLIGLRPACSPGCDETLRENFSKDSILLWCLTNHKEVRRRCHRMMEVDNVRLGGKMRRLGGWGRQQREWVEAVRELVRGR